jgi:predicted GTPase
VNALFGEVRAAVDVVPTTVRVTPYVLDRLGGKDAVSLLDMGGYDDPTIPQERIDAVLAQALQADCILLVCSALNAAREPDRRLVQSIRDYFSDHPELRPPPLLVALTHIDRLRPPLVWEPPYNIVTPQTPKARSIRGALDAVASDLGLTSMQIIPVCLHAERLYNIEEALMPALVQSLPEAKRTLLVRGLKTMREQEQWTILGRQAQTAGLFLLEIGGEVLQKVVGTVVYETRGGRKGKGQERS